MSKCNYAKRKKLLVNVFESDLSASDKITFYAMSYKYIDGEQLLDYIQKQSPSPAQIVEYVEEKLRENRVSKNGKEETTD